MYTFLWNQGTPWLTEYLVWVAGLPGYLYLSICCQMLDRWLHLWTGHKELLLELGRPEVEPFKASPINSNLIGSRGLIFWIGSMRASCHAIILIKYS